VGINRVFFVGWVHVESVSGVEMDGRNMRELGAARKCGDGGCCRRRRGEYPWQK
jgi:hypothetical protein